MQNLSDIRRPRKVSKKASYTASALIFLAGAALGIISKCLDDLGLDSTVWWHRIIEKLRLPQIMSGLPFWVFLAMVVALYSSSSQKAAVNAFLFLAGSCEAYHIWTIVVSGFNNTSYMLIWYSMTVISPLIAAVCWYSKGKGAVAIILDIIMIAVMFDHCFAVGWFYVGLRGIFEAAVFAATVAVLYRDWKQTAISLPLGIALGFLICRLPVFSF